MHKELSVYLNGMRMALLNQARAWFLEIDVVHKMCVRMYICVCVSAPRQVITSGMMWHDIDLI